MKKNGMITLAVIAHLYFSDEDYADKKAFIKCNPAIKTVNDRKALREALADRQFRQSGRSAPRAFPY